MSAGAAIGTLGALGERARALGGRGPVRLLVATGLFGLALGLFLRGAERRFGNGDEVLYAEMAREMAASGDLLWPRWQGRPVLDRPPAALWPLALAVRLGGVGGRDRADWGLRATVAAEMAAAVALLFLFGARRMGPGLGLGAALLFATSERVLAYAGYLESEPLLILLLVASGLCWEKARERPAWAAGFGACLGLSLLTKQVVGALPLLFPLLDRVGGRPLSRRALGRGLAVAAALALPWLLVSLAHHGAAFPRAFFLRTVLARTVRPLHQSTTPLFYLGMLWRREGPLILVAALGLVYAAARRDLLPLAWAAAVLVPYSIVASRYDYYALLAYPALCLGAARLPVERARGLLLAPVVLGWALTHLLGSGTGPPVPLDPEPGQLAAEVARVSRPDDVLLVVDQLPFSARYYSGRRTVQLVFDRESLEEVRFLLPSEVYQVSDVPAFLAGFARWFAIVPQVERDKLRGAGRVYRLAETPRYLLLTNVPGP